MTKLFKIFLSLCFFCPGLCGGAARAQDGPGFLIKNPLQFPFPLPEVATENVSFRVYSQIGTISKFKAKVEEFKDPDGQTRPPERVVVTSPEPGKSLTPQGARISLQLRTQDFRRSGDYRITLRLTGNYRNPATANSPEKLLDKDVDVVIQRPVAEINETDIKGQTVQLYRTWPWETASGQVPLAIAETSGKATLRDLLIQGQPLYAKDSKVLVNGWVWASDSSEPQPTGSPQPTSVSNQKLSQMASEHKFTVSPGGQQNLVLSFRDIPRCGAFTTQLALTSPNLASRKVIPLNVSVTDWFFFPLLAIIIGVGGGFLTNYLAQNWRPRQVNRYYILRLREAIRRSLGTVTNPVKQQALEAMLSNLWAVESTNDLGDATVVKAQLEQISKDLIQFHAGEAKVKDDTNLALNALKTQVALYQQNLPQASTEEKSRLQSLLDQASGVEQALGNNQVDQANTLLAPIQAEFTNFKTIRVRQDLKSRSAALDVLQAGATDQPIRDLLSEARVAANNGKPDEAIAKLDEIDAELEALIQQQQHGQGARGGAPQSLSQRLLPWLGFGIAAPPQTRIEIASGMSARVSGQPISFRIEDPENLTQGATLTWDFSDGTASVKLGLTASHTFNESGDYEVKVSISQGNPAKLSAELLCPLTVLPGPVERQNTQIRRSISTSDWLMFGIAVLLASLTGLLYLYVDKPFGSLTDYLTALLWGFGIDNSVRGFAAVLKRINTPA